MDDTVVPLLLPRALRPCREFLLRRLAARVDAIRDKTLPDHVLANVEQNVTVPGLHLARVDDLHVTVVEAVPSRVSVVADERGVVPAAKGAEVIDHPEELISWQLPWRVAYENIRSFVKYPDCEIVRLRDCVSLESKSLEFECSFSSAHAYC